MGVDLAISEKATADYTAACILGRDASGSLHVLDMARTRASFSQQIDFIKQLATKWQPSIVGIEDVQYQKAMVQQISAQTSLNVRGIRPDRDKVSRFAPLEGRYELGQVLHVRGLPQEFEAELLGFPMGAHDDYVDSMSIAFAALDESIVADCGWGVSRLKGRIRS
jgi:predicted phage terminase large subunit-like protein